jgi:cellulose synthase/poly-beta-1,6-N-acetylglucosamine synthase-like glycosyltransferase
MEPRPSPANSTPKGFASSQSTRWGKSAGLNRAVALARGEIVVFTDANAAYPAGTIRALVRHFSDP